jgi:hypothetical protein
MLTAVAPDLVWVYRFFKELKTGKLGPKSLFSKFHKWIQWGEFPKGMFIDAIWLCASLAVVAGLIR